MLSRSWLASTSPETTLGRWMLLGRMVAGYGMTCLAALDSNDTRGLAIDMDISWSGALSVKDGDGATHVISTSPRDNSSPQLQNVGRSYGVVKLKSDPPHWSIDDHYEIGSFNRHNSLGWGNRCADSRSCASYGTAGSFSGRAAKRA
jgi:hypothetical protein